jgi:hypothetical protein
LAISLSLVLILGVGVGFLIRYAGLRVLHALVCAAFGFTLAATSIAAQISHTLNAIVRILSGHG